LDCGKSFEKKIAAAWHEDQTGHDNWSDQQDVIGYAVPHITKCYQTRHEAIGKAAIMGREAPDRVGDVQSFTKRVASIGKAHTNLR